MDISASTILFAVIALVIGVVAGRMWARRGTEPLSVEGVLEGVAEARNLIKEYFDTAMIAVHFLEQISKPEAPGEPEKLSNQEKRARALAIVKRHYPQATMEEIDMAVEGAVHAVKQLRRLGVPIPNVQLTGEDELDKFLSGGSTLTPPPSGLGV